MTGENKQGKNEKKQQEQPAAQVELTDDQLEQVTGGGIIWDGIANPAPYPPGPSVGLERDN